MLTAIIVAGGDSRRMGFDKLLARIAGKPVIAHTIRAFEHAKSVDEVVVVGRADRLDEIEAAVRDEKFAKVRSIIPGGKRRQDSVQAGLNALEPGARYVAVHDAARPLIAPEQIDRVFQECMTFDAASLAEPVNDTLKRADGDLRVTDSVDREHLYAMQTPQIFERQLLEKAYHAVYAEDLSITDEVSAVERLGRRVALVLNDDFNFKITYRRDLPLAEVVLQQRENPPQH